MMSSPYKSLLLFVALFSSQQVAAQAFYPAAKVVGAGKMMGGLSLSKSEIDYDIDAGDIDVERTILGGSFNVGLTPSVDLLAQVGYSIDSEIEDADADGSGFIIGGGANVIALQDQGVRVHVGGLLNYVVEGYENDTPVGDVEYDLSVFDIHVFGNVGYVVNRAVMPYLGLDLAISDGELEIKLPSGADGDDDIERDDSLSLILGSHFLVNNILLRVEARLVGEQTLTLGASTAL